MSLRSVLASQTFKHLQGRRCAARLLFSCGQWSLRRPRSTELGIGSSVVRAMLDSEVPYDGARRAPSTSLLTLACPAGLGLSAPALVYNEQLPSLYASRSSHVACCLSSSRVSRAIAAAAHDSEDEFERLMRDTLGADGSTGVESGARSPSPPSSLDGDAVCIGCSDDAEDAASLGASAFAPLPRPLPPFASVALSQSLGGPNHIRCCFPTGGAAADVYVASGDPPRREPTGRPADDAVPARAPALDADLEALRPEWKAALPPSYPLRFAQARILLALQTGADVVGIAATGSGKTLCMTLPAAAEYIQAVLARTADVCEPIDLILFPWAALGPMHEHDGTALLNACVAHRLPGQARRRHPRVLFVDREHAPPTLATSPAPVAGSLLCGHPKCGAALALSDVRHHQRDARCDRPSCHRNIEPDDRRWHCTRPGCEWDTCLACACQLTTQPVADAQPSGQPRHLPCGMCPACTDPTYSAARKQALPFGCAYNCRIWPKDPEHPDFCRSCKGRKGAARCEQRKALDAEPSAGDGSPSMTVRATRTVSAVDAASSTSEPLPVRSLASPEGGTVAASTSAGREAAKAPTPPKPQRRLEDLPLHAHERAIAEDASVRIVACTVSALRASSDSGRLLRLALARRGVRRLTFDELHGLSRSSAASWHKDLAAYAELCDELCAMLRQHGHPRPQFEGFTSTLPPALTDSTLAAGRFAADTRVVRCAIDRPELSFIRLAMPWRPKVKSQLQWAQHTLDHICNHTPSWALAGFIIVFCATAAFAKAAKAALSVRRLHGGGPRPNVCYVGVENMSAASRREALRTLAQEPDAVVFATESLGQGWGTPGCFLVVHLAFGLGPLEMWQRSGRAARGAHERALVVFLLSARMLVEQLRLCDAANPTAGQGMRLIMEHLLHRTCFRRAQLLYLGQTAVDEPCSGCDRCGALPERTETQLGILPHTLGWLRTNAAVVQLADDLQAEGIHRPKLTELLDRASLSSPPPFDTPVAHNLLVYALLVDKTLRWEPVGGLSPQRHTPPSATPHRNSHYCREPPLPASSHCVARSSLARTARHSLLAPNFLCSCHRHILRLAATCRPWGFRHLSVGRRPAHRLPRGQAPPRCAAPL